MALEGRSAEKLRLFLRSLPEATRGQLSRGLRSAIERGDDFPAAALILQELDACGTPGVAAVVDAPPTAPEPEAAVPRPRPDPARQLNAFIAPFAPFVVEGPAGQRPPGRLVRAHLETIWTWLGEQVMADDIAAFADSLAEADDEAAVAAAFRERALKPIRAAMNARRADVAGPIQIPQLGRNGAVDTLQFLVLLMELEGALGAALVQFPSFAGPMNDGRLLTLRNQLDKMGLPRDLLQCVLIAIMRRLDDPSAVARVATLNVEEGKSARLAASPYAGALNAVLDDIEDNVFLLRQSMATGKGADLRERLKTIHDTIRGFRTVIDGFQDSEWGRRLGEIRKQISGLLKAEIEVTPGRVRRIIRIPTREQGASRPVDSIDVAETESSINLTSVCRQYASELALNEVANRCFGELQHSLDVGTRSLVDSLRSVSGAERAARESQVAAAIRFCAIVFGAEYASLLSKAADVALRGERKPARA